LSILGLKPASGAVMKRNALRLWPFLWAFGWLVAEDKHSKTIAPHLAYPNEKENRKGCGIMVIPAGGDSFYRVTKD